MTITSEDAGYAAIYEHYLRENYPQKFNYSGYQWLTLEDLSFLRLTNKAGNTTLEDISGSGHEDRPFIQQAR